MNIIEIPIAVPITIPTTSPKSNPEIESIFQTTNATLLDLEIILDSSSVMMDSNSKLFWEFIMNLGNGENRKCGSVRIFENIDFKLSRQEKLD